MPQSQFDTGLNTRPPDFRSALPWLVPLLVGLCALYIPTYMVLSNTVWISDEQGHGPIILAVCIWLMWRKRLDYLALAETPTPIAGSVALVFGGLLYLLGRTQDLDTFAVGSQIFILIGIFLWLKGWSAVRLMAFPLLFMIFMVPLPSVLVQVVTVPLKTAVSYVAESILYQFGYPVARTGVIISVGQYQLLVADACAGLQTLLTLEALGLFYLNVVRHTSVFRNVTLAILIVPISFTANVIRVIVLSLITYHFGDAAGQGFLHGFAGLVLFASALLLIIGLDSLLQWAVKTKEGIHVAPPRNAP